MPIWRELAAALRVDHRRQIALTVATVNHLSGSNSQSRRSVCDAHGRST